MRMTLHMPDSIFSFEQIRVELTQHTLETRGTLEQGHQQGGLVSGSRWPGHHLLTCCCPSVSADHFCGIRVFLEGSRSLGALAAASNRIFTRLFTWELTLQCTAVYDRSQNRCLSSRETRLPFQQNDLEVSKNWRPYMWFCIFEPIYFELRRYLTIIYWSLPTRIASLEFEL